jgi:hypothetical protein
MARYLSQHLGRHARLDPAKPPETAEDLWMDGMGAQAIHFFAWTLTDGTFTSTTHNNTFVSCLTT